MSFLIAVKTPGRPFFFFLRILGDADEQRDNSERSRAARLGFSSRAALNRSRLQHTTISALTHRSDDSLPYLFLLFFKPCNNVKHLFFFLTRHVSPRSRSTLVRNRNVTRPHATFPLVIISTRFSEANLRKALLNSGISTPWIFSPSLPCFFFPFPLPPLNADFSPATWQLFHAVSCHRAIAPYRKWKEKSWAGYQNANALERKH